MGLPKGRTNNPKGRKKGSENKVTKDLRKLIKEFLDRNFDNVQKEYNKLESKEKLYFYKDLLKYAIPTIQTTDITSDGEKITGFNYLPPEIKIVHLYKDPEDTEQTKN